MELKIVYRPFGVGKMRLLLHMERSLLGFTEMGFQEKDIDDVKERIHSELCADRVKNIAITFLNKDEMNALETVDAVSLQIFAPGKYQYLFNT